MTLTYPHQLLNKKPRKRYRIGAITFILSLSFILSISLIIILISRRGLQGASLILKVQVKTHFVQLGVIRISKFFGFDSLQFKEDTLFKIPVVWLIVFDPV